MGVLVRLGGRSTRRAEWVVVRDGWVGVEAGWIEVGTGWIGVDAGGCVGGILLMKRRYYSGWLGEVSQAVRFLFQMSCRSPARRRVSLSPAWPSS